MGGSISKHECQLLLLTPSTTTRTAFPIITWFTVNNDESGTWKVKTLVTRSNYGRISLVSRLCRVKGNIHLFLDFPGDAVNHIYIRGTTVARAIYLSYRKA